MKTCTLLLLLCGLTTTIYSQSGEFPIGEHGAYQYERVDKVNGSQDEIYTACLIALTQQFKSQHREIEIQERSEGLIIGNVTLYNNYIFEGCRTTYTFTFQIVAKDNAYQTILTFDERNEEAYYRSDMRFHKAEEMNDINRARYWPLRDGIVTRRDRIDHLIIHDTLVEKLNEMAGKVRKNLTARKGNW